MTICFFDSAKTAAENSSRTYERNWCRLLRVPRWGRR